MARKKVQRDEPSGDEWLATYSDCVTLLMTFFVLLYAMSSTDEAKMRALSQAFRSVMAGEVGDSILEYNLYNFSPDIFFPLLVFPCDNAIVLIFLYIL